MHAQTILKGKDLAGDMCIGGSAEICAVRAIAAPSRISDTCVGCNLCITQKYGIKATEFER